MVNLVFVFALMRDDSRWLGIVVYQYVLQGMECYFKEGVTSDSRSYAVLSNIGMAHTFVLWCWRKEVLANLDLQVRLKLKEHYYKELFEFFPDAIALYTTDGVAYANKCCVKAFDRDLPEDEQASQERRVQKSFRNELKRTEGEVSLDSQATLQSDRVLQPS